MYFSGTLLFFHFSEKLHFSRVLQEKRRIGKVGVGSNSGRVVGFVAELGGDKTTVGKEVTSLDCY